MSSFIHTTAEGRKIALKDLRDSHLNNIIGMIERMAKEGITVRRGGGSEAEDMWYDEEELIGQEVKDHMDYNKYIEEQQRRRS